jgi:DNA-binding NarL/FixJ family response regulator
MARQATQHKASGYSAPSAADPQDLLRRLVQAALQVGCGASPATDSSGRELVLDQELDGARYLLLRARPHPPHLAVSPREREIVRMVAKGYPNKIIADVLEISCWTVSTHLRRIFAKLGVGSRAAMVAKLVAEGLLDEPERAPGGKARSRPRTA